MGQAKGIVIDSRLANKIESLYDMSFGCDMVFVIKFKDLQDSFRFDNMKSLQNFVNNQQIERFYNKELTKGYFDYINENDETLRYFIQRKKGNLKVINEICLNN